MSNKPPISSLRLLALPGPEEWELWKFDRELPPARIATAPDCAGLSISPTAIVALPSTEWHFISGWYASGERQTVSEMLALQMEAEGISDNSEHAIWDFHILVKEESRSLVSAACLEGGATSLHAVEQIGGATGTFEIWNFEENSATIWRELGRWNCAVKNGGHVIALQLLGSVDADVALVSEVKCLLLQLEREHLANDVDKIVVWGALKNREAFSKIALPVMFHKQADPKWPVNALNLLPHSYRQRNARMQKNKVIRNVAKGIALLAAMLILALVLQTAWLWSKHRGVESYLEKNEATVSGIRAAAARWEAIASAIEGERSALEVFYRCARNLPDHGVYLTVFHYKPSEVVIVGEGNNIPGVVDFQNRISRDKELSDYQWKIPPPRILPNNLARFEISGTRPDHGPIQDTE